MLITLSSRIILGNSLLYNLKIKKSDRNIKYVLQINYILSFEEVTLKFISAGEQVLFRFLAFKLYEIEEIAIFLFQKSLIVYFQKFFVLVLFDFDYILPLCFRLFKSEAFVCMISGNS